MQNDLTVGVLIITYNQEDLISETLDSILSQECEYSFDIVIGDDFSTDGTLNVINSYKEKYPEIIHVLPSETNLGIVANFYRCYNYSDYDFVFVCAGDDYWSDKNKMQKQLNVLLQDDTLSVCCSSYRLYYQEENRYETVAKEGHRIDKSIISKSNNIVPSTCVYRKSKLPVLDKSFLESPFEDWYLLCLYSDKGDIYWMSDVTTVYRQHSLSAYAGIDTGKRLLWRFRAAEFINEKIRKDSPAIFLRNESYYIKSIFLSKDLSRNEKLEFLDYLKKYGFKQNKILKLSCSKNFGFNRIVSKFVDRSICYK